MTEPRRPPGPAVLDQRAWEPQLAARATEKLPDGFRMHGYHVLGDLAKHYAYSDVVYLSLTGELPDNRSAKLFAIALTACAPAWVGDGPAHGAVLTRVSNASVATSLAVGMIGAAAEVQAVVTAHADLLAWLAAPTSDVPAAFRGASAAAAALVDLARGIDPRLDVPRRDMTVDAAVIALMSAAGIRTPDQLMGALLVGRICGISAEVLATGPQHFFEYPVQVPPFRYVDTPR